MIVDSNTLCPRIKRRLVALSSVKSPDGCATTTVKTARKFSTFGLFIFIKARYLFYLNTYAALYISRRGGIA